MIDMKTQQQQQEVVTRPASLSEPARELETKLTVMCAICDAVYAPSPLQMAFLQQEQGILEATFMSMCHFCFRCRRAACPQCWDEVHGVCGACVQEAHLPFRTAVPPLDGVLFPPVLKRSQTQQQNASSLLMLERPGRFSLDTQAAQDNDTGSRIQPVLFEQVGTPAEPATKLERSGLPFATPMKTPLLEVLTDDDKPEKAQSATKKEKKTSRLELVLTWIVLVILLLLVALIALAEYFPAVNTLVARLAHIDIHAEIAYLVHVVQQIFKK